MECLRWMILRCLRLMFISEWLGNVHLFIFTHICGNAITQVRCHPDRLLLINHIIYYYHIINYLLVNHIKGKIMIKRCIAFKIWHLWMKEFMKIDIRHWKILCGSKYFLNYIQRGSCSALQSRKIILTLYFESLKLKLNN